MVVAFFYFRLHLAYFSRPAVAISARPEQRKPEDAGRMLESWKTEVYDPTEEYLAHLRFGGTAFLIVGALTALAALLD